MSNYIHLTCRPDRFWQPLSGFTPSNIQASFIKFKVPKSKRSLISNHLEALYVLKVNKYVREYPPDRNNV